MNYCRKLWPLLGFVMLLFYSCERDDGVCEDDSGGISSHPFVRETRAYFEDYVSTEMEFETRGLHPGLIAPDWDKVKVFTQPESGTMSVDVPLWTEASYEGSFYMRNDSGEVSSTDTYYTAILQKLIVVKSLERDALSCYIATIIPDAEHATRNSSLIDDMFCGGDPNTKFSGTVMYSTVTTNYTIGVERYKDGMLCEDVSLFYASANVWDDYEAMIRLIGAKNIQRSVRVMTRSGEMGDGSIMLPEVVIPGHRPDPTPPPSLPPPPSPPSPWPSTPPVNNPPVQPPPSSGGGGSHSGGGNSGTNQSGVPKVKYSDPLYAGIAAKINAIFPQIYKKLVEMGLDLSGIEFEVGVGCAANAQRKGEGLISLCMKFVTSGYTVADQVAIVWHEIYHDRHDAPFNLNEQKLYPSIMISNIPTDKQNFIYDVLLEGGGSTYDYVRETTINYIYDPQYYLNEINTYRKEIETHKNVSEYYAREREYMLWYYQQYLIYARIYYNKK